MTTPAPAVTVTADQPSYAVGDKITVTVDYSDPANPGTQLTVTATVNNADGTTSTGTATVSVGSAAASPLAVSVTDSFGDTYTQASNVAGTAVFSAVIGTPPAGA